MWIRIATGIASVIALLTLVVLIARRAPSTVHAKRTYRAPVAKVWAAWTDPELIKRWWGPADSEVTNIENDLRVGGKFLFCLKTKGEETPLCRAGVYEEVEAGAGFKSSFGFSDEKGVAIPSTLVPMPGHWPDQIKMTVTFKPIGAGETRVDVVQRGIPMIMKFPAKWGWRQQLAKLDKLF